jgi:type II secretion system protein H
MASSNYFPLTTAGVGSRCRNLGFTLLEVLVVLVILGILTAMAAPSLRGMVDHAYTSRVLNRLVADIYFTRTTAVRDGIRYQLRYEHVDIGGRNCIHRYEIRPQHHPDAPVRVVVVGEVANGVCLSTSGNQVTFDSRGIATMGRTFTATRGRVEKRVIMSRLGRIRWQN